MRNLIDDAAPFLHQLSSSLKIVLKGVPDITGSDFGQDQYHDAIADFFLATVKQFGPAILLIDDVQWLDEASLQVLKRINFKLHALPLMILGTSRSDPKNIVMLERFRVQLSRVPFTELSLGPLDKDGISRYVASLLGIDETDGDLNEEIMTCSGGNFPVILWSRKRSAPPVLPVWGAGWIMPIICRAAPNWPGIS